MVRNIVFHQEDLIFQPFLQVFFISWRNYWSELFINKVAVTLIQIMLPEQEQLILGFETSWLLDTMLDFITHPVLLLLEVVCLPLCCALVLPEHLTSAGLLSIICWRSLLSFSLNAYFRWHLFSFISLPTS